VDHADSGNNIHALYYCVSINLAKIVDKRHANMKRDLLYK